MTSNSTHVHRRHFLGAVGALAAHSCLLPHRSLKAEANFAAAQTICCFAKPLQHMKFDELADRLAEMGFQGIEATIRKGGQVEPARVADDLPRLVEALKKRDLEVTIMASDVNSVDQPETEAVLRTAAQLGITRYRMQYFTYDLKQPIRPQLQKLRPGLKQLAALNRELGITGVYQNHSGAKYVGAPLWDIYELICELPPAELGIAYDIRHATVEGGQSWPLEFQLVQSHLNMVFLKDFAWEGRQVKNVPLGSGMVSPKFFDMMRQANFKGPISLQMEYVDHRDPSLLDESLKAISHDMKVLQQWLST
jgi:sugar phosphate isomerase/epimerase